MTTVDKSEDVEQRAAIGGARRAMACISHELSGPLMAIQTHLKLAQRRHADPSIETALRCVDRIREITTSLQRASRSDASQPVATDVATAARGCSIAGRAVPVEIGAPAARVDAQSAGFILQAAMHAVARTAADGAEIRVRIDGARCLVGEPGAGDWRAVSPLTTARHGLDLWLAALIALDAGGHVQVCDVEGTLAVQVTLAEAP